MKIPKSLKISGHNVKVICPYLWKERFDFNGQYDKDQSEIRLSLVDSGGIPRSESEIAVTFLHEILHAVDFVTGHRVFSGIENEKIIEGISEGLFQV